MERSAPDFIAILEVLHRHDVDFIIVGALSAVLQGAPVMTFDLDVVHHRDEDNIARVSNALDELEAQYRGHGDRVLTPTKAHLNSPGHQLLITKFGPLDLLGVIEDELSYGDLLPHAVDLFVDSLSFKILRLRKYVELKEKSPREKDSARLPVLRQALKEQNDSCGDF